MSFSLVNVGTMYQRMVNKLLKDMMGQNMEAYVNNMLLKSIKG